MRGHFRPEFVNRVDEFIVFDALGRTQLESIVRLQADRVQARLRAKKMRMELTDEAVEYLAERGYDPAFGARPVKRVVQQELETALAKGILRGDFGEDDVVAVRAPGGAAAAGLVLERAGGGAAGDGAGVVEERPNPAELLP